VWGGRQLACCVLNYHQLICVQTEQGKPSNTKIVSFLHSLKLSTLSANFVLSAWPQSCLSHAGSDKASKPSRIKLAQMSC